MSAGLFPVSRRRPTWLLVLVPIALILLYIHPPLHLPSGVLPPSKFTFKANSATEHLKSKAMQNYWKQLHNELTKNKPDVPLLKPSRNPTDEEIDAGKNDNDSPRPSLIDMADGDVEKMQSHHKAFVAAVKTLGPKLPVWKGKKGIVMTAGGGYIGTALTSILMLRRSGSSLPVHLFLDTHAERDPRLCDDVLPRINVECLIMEDLKGAAGVKHYQYKVLSILLSPFEQILYLDSDAWPIHPPERLFDEAPFTSHGLITWPDFWLYTVSPIYYQIAHFDAPRTLTRRSSESGILLYDKSTHAESLLLATYYNWYGPGYYYPLFSQGAPGEGDKETFVQAASALRQPFWDVRTPDRVMGRWINGTFETAGMKQADPAEDYRLHGATANTDHAREDPDEKKRKAAKPLFIHHNLFKMDISKVGNPDDPIFRLDEHGNPTRLWGPDKSIVETSGFDVERAMWDVVLAANCGQTFLAECANLKRWYQAVFVEAPPLVGEP